MLGGLGSFLEAHSEEVFSWLFQFLEDTLHSLVHGPLSPQPATLRLIDHSCIVTPSSDFLLLPSYIFKNSYD